MEKTYKQPYQAPCATMFDLKHPLDILAGGFSGEAVFDSPEEGDIEWGEQATYGAHPRIYTYD